MERLPTFFLIPVLALGLAVSCAYHTIEKITLPTPDWTDRTHGKETPPQYNLVFPPDHVNTIEIEMTADDWAFILDDVSEKINFPFGKSGVRPQEPGTTAPEFLSADPEYVPVSVKFNGLEWYKVGFRLKGNSTLVTAWRNASYKLPFKLQFDEFEDKYPEIKDQRLYGFKEVCFAPAIHDNSMIREKIAPEIFRAAGIPAPRTAFYKVYINYGNGKKYCGVYTIVEVVDDTMIKDAFGEDDGNIYKPTSRFSTFDIDEFEKKNNKKESDYADVIAAIELLNGPLRTTDPEAWRISLETHFNVDHFLRWLAVNTTMLNWDTYGNTSQNYYLYNLTGKGLTWIPWDNNEALYNRGARKTITPPLNNISDKWPLIRYLMDDPVYKEKYRAYMKEFIDTVFVQDKLEEMFQYNHNLIAPYVVGPEAIEEPDATYLENHEAFQTSLNALRFHVQKQLTAVKVYLR